MTGPGDHAGLGAQVRLDDTRHPRVPIALPPSLLSPPPVTTGLSRGVGEHRDHPASTATKEGSTEIHATVDADHLPVDPLAVVRHQVGDHGRDVGRLAQAPAPSASQVAG